MTDHNAGRSTVRLSDRRMSPLLLPACKLRLGSRALCDREFRTCSRCWLLTFLAFAFSSFHLLAISFSCWCVSHGLLLKPSFVLWLSFSFAESSFESFSFADVVGALLRLCTRSPCLFLCSLLLFPSVLVLLLGAMLVLMRLPVAFC